MRLAHRPSGTILYAPYCVSIIKYCENREGHCERGHFYYVRRDCLRSRGKAHTTEKHFRLPSSFPTVRRGVVKELDAAKMKAEIGIGPTLGALAVE